MKIIRNSIDKYKYVCVACIVSGFLAHFYALTNILQNYDNVEFMPAAYGIGLISGRWMLALLGKIMILIGGSYNLPFFNGLLTILILTIVACLIVDLFGLKDKYAVLFGAIFICFPTVTGTMFFMYTAPYYAVAVLMAVLAVSFTEKYKFGFLIAIVLEACSLGIYQAYIPMTAVLFVLLLIVKTIKDNNLIFLLKKSFFYLFILAGGFVAYFLILKLFLCVMDMQLGTYASIDKMGQMKMGDIPEILKKCYTHFFELPLHDYHGISATPILQICILALEISSIILAIDMLRGEKGRNAKAFLCLFYLIFVFPLAVNGIEILCFNSRIYVLMIYSVVFIYLVPLILLDLRKKMQHGLGESRKPSCCFNYCEKIILSSTIICILSYVYFANVNYTSMFYMNQQTTSYFISMVTRIKDVEGFDASYQWALIGDTIQDPGFENPWAVAQKYGGNPDSLLNAYSRNSYLREYLGCKYDAVDEWRLNEIKNMDIVQNMPCYPNSGSIRVINDVVVIKLSND